MAVHDKNSVLQSYHSLYRWLLFLVGITGFSSCHLDDLSKEIPYAPVFALPVGELTYTGRDLFERLMTESDITAAERENIHLEEDEEGILRYVYVWDTTFYFDEHLPLLMDNMSEYHIVQEQDMPVLPTSQSFEIHETQHAEITVGDNQLDSVRFTGGDLTVQAVSTYPPEMRSMVLLPMLLRPGTYTPLHIPFDFLYENNIPPTQDQTRVYPLEGYTLRQRSTPAGRRFEMQYRVRSDIAAGVRVQRGDSVRYRTAFRSATFNRFYGLVAPKDVHVFNRTRDIGIFQQFGEVFFVNPAVHIEMKNSYGIPFTLLLEGAGFLTTDDQERRLTGAVIQRPQFIDAPSLQRIGDLEQTRLAIHAQNSNIAQVISSRIQRLRLPIQVRFSPERPFEQFENHFYTEASKVDMHTRMVLPLEVVFESLVYDMRFLNAGLLVEVPEQAQTGVLRLRTLNSLPVEGIITFSFMKDGVVIYRIPKEKKIHPPSMHEDGTVAEAHENRIELPLDRDELHQYKLADETRVRFDFSTPRDAQGQRMQSCFHAQDDLVIQLSIRVHTSF